MPGTTQPPRDDADGSPGASRLSPALLAAMRDSFVLEVAERLPRLLAYAARLTAQPPSASVDDGRTEAASDAHLLCGSAAVLGEPSVARAAHVLELSLLAGDLAAVPSQVRSLTGRLGPWCP